jgi:hypothetical protein
MGFKGRERTASSYNRTEEEEEKQTNEPDTTRTKRLLHLDPRILLPRHGRLLFAWSRLLNRRPLAKRNPYQNEIKHTEPDRSRVEEMPFMVTG